MLTLAFSSRQGSGYEYNFAWLKILIKRVFKFSNLQLKLKNVIIQLTLYVLSLSSQISVTRSRLILLFKVIGVKGGLLLPAESA